VGGWYDEPNRISITQREYREAYEQHLLGKLKILSFVRSEVWQMKEDRRELAKFLERIGLSETTRKSIENHPSKFATDAEFLINFLNEVGRNRETKLAVQGQTPSPTGNWLHTVSVFRDVVDVLQGQVFFSIPVEDMAARRLLRRELREFVGQCLVKFESKGNVYSPRFVIERFHEECPIYLEEKRDVFISVSTKRWDAISMLAMHLLARQLHPVVLPQVLSRPTFLEFELSSNSYKETPVYDALLRLQDEIRRFNFSNTSENLSVLFEHSSRAQPHRGTSIKIETVRLVGLFHLLDRWSNVLDLSTSILKHLEGAPFVAPDLRPDTPVQGMQKMLEDERLTDQDISSFVAGEK
jgi:hypothetical protein